MLIPKNSTILCFLGASNMDKNTNIDFPNKFSVPRHQSASLTFGQGIKYCLGKHLVTHN